MVPLGYLSSKKVWFVDSYAQHDRPEHVIGSDIEHFGTAVLVSKITVLCAVRPRNLQFPSGEKTREERRRLLLCSSFQYLEEDNAMSALEGNIERHSDSSTLFVQHTSKIRLP